MFLLIRVTAQLSPRSPGRHLLSTWTVCTCTGLQCCVISYTIIAYVLNIHRAPQRVQHPPLHCPQGCSMLLRVPPGVCSLPGLSCCMLSLAAFHSEMVRFPTQTGLNSFGVTKVVKSPPAWEQSQNKFRQNKVQKERSHGSALWFYFSKDFANESEKNLKEMELCRK